MPVAVVCAIVAASLGFLWIYTPVLAGLAGDWLHDANYSHGLLIVPLALYFAWERRHRLAAREGPAVALVVVGAGLSLLLVGQLGAELFLTRVSLVVVLAGATWYLGGWGAMRTLSFPIVFLLLMIPIPAILFNQIAFPLQLLASQVGQFGMEVAGVPVLREGNVIVLAQTTLEVAEACSGIRSLMSLLTLGIVYGYFSDPRPTVRMAIALTTLPIAVLTNGARVAGTGVAAHYYGGAAADGFFHTFSGWLVFVTALAALAAAAAIVIRVAPRRGASAQPRQPMARGLAS